MAKLIDTRIALRIDSYANWTNEQLGAGKGALFVLNRGEMGICEIPSGNSAATTAPTVLFKIGDGSTPFKSLKWGSALAADVYDWAKCKTVELDGQIIKFHNGDKTKPVHTIDLSTFVTHDELNTALENYYTKTEINNTIANYYTKTEADPAFTTAEEVIAAVNKALADVSGEDAVTNITTLVEYVNNNAGDLAALIEEVYGAKAMTGTSRIDTAVSDAATAKSDAATAKSDAATAKSDAATALSTANQAKEAATTAQTSAANSAAAAANSAAAAANSEGSASASANTALGHADAANNAKKDAVTAKNAAVTAQGAAEDAQEAAEAAHSAAELAKTAAESAQAKAEAAQAAAEASNTSATAIANEAKSQAATAASDASKAKSDAANALSKVNSLTTDDIEGGEEVWIFNCGTSTTVI